MKDSYTNNVVVAQVGTSGKATSRALAAIMNLLIKLLTKLGLLKKDLDYHVVRASTVIMLAFFGYQKWFGYEAHTLIPFWAFRNGCSSRSCSWDSGIRS